MLLLSVSVRRLPKSATSQSMWVLSRTVKFPGFAHDNGRGYMRKTRKEIALRVTSFMKNSLGRGECLSNFCLVYVQSRSLLGDQ